ncbi:MAG TPA: HDOD domain-containing protein [Rubrivivax sp.]|nr:HDOD domain-containing protein [Rubrivivax sp.]
MNEHPVLAQVVLGYCPQIDRQRKISATRLTVFPQRPDAAPDARELLQALAEGWPEGGEPLQLNIASEGLLRDISSAEPPLHISLELPAFMAADAQLGPALAALHARGNLLLLKGRPAGELPQTVLQCFKLTIVEFGDDRRDAPDTRGGTRSLGFVQSGVTRASEVEQSFARGAAAVLGWPIDEALGRGSGKAVAPDLKVIVELINRVDRQESIDRLEAVLKNDPTLAFRLVRYINSAAFGLRVEISSFRHAIMMLGYQKLERWLALLLASASTDPNMRPVMFAAVRRGLFMEELVRSTGDEQMSSEIFICGVFSLLDIMMGQPFEQLLKSIPVPQDVHDALVRGSGRYQPYLELVRAVEQESLFDIRGAAESLMLSAAEVNRALLRALAAARQLE